MRPSSPTHFSAFNQFSVLALAAFGAALYCCQSSGGESFNVSAAAGGAGCLANQSILGFQAALTRRADPEPDSLGPAHPGGERRPSGCFRSCSTSLDLFYLDHQRLCADSKVSAFEFEFVRLPFTSGPRSYFIRTGISPPLVTA
jgi:hypothetical protein